MRVLDLFAGIGGFSLGLERTGGFRTAAFCEIDPNAQKVLKKHWPNVPIFEDVSTLTKDQIDAKIEVITGGFPCQDISTAGQGAGLAGSRSGLWFHYQRLIDEIQPRYAIIENVSALRSRGLDQVLRSLFQIGYDAEWHCIPASALGAPHRRDRIWIVAYPTSVRPSGSGLFRRPSNPTADTDWEASWIINGSEAKTGSWDVEPNVGRVAHGVPNRLHRLKQLGNAIVPQIAQLIGEAILADQWGKM